LLGLNPGLRWAEGNSGGKQTASSLKLLAAKADRVKDRLAT